MNEIKIYFWKKREKTRQEKLEVTCTTRTFKNLKGLD